MTKEEQKTFLELLAEIPEFRKGNAIKYSLRDVLFLAIFAILCGANTYTGMHTFSELHINELRKYLELPEGIPSHDVFGDIISRVDIQAVNECFRIFTDQIRMSEMQNAVVALDGKTIRRSQSEKHRAFHIETAYLSDMQIVLGQVAIDEKSNEITAIPKLLEMLALQKCTVTIDAIGTHESIAKAVRNTGAEYILPVKENQSTMLDDIRFYAENEIFTVRHSVLAEENRYAVQNDKGHGRIEKRECYLFDSADWLKEQYHWTDLHGVAVIRSTRTMINTGETSTYDRYFSVSCERPKTQRKQRKEPISWYNKCKGKRGNPGKTLHLWEDSGCTDGTLDKFQCWNHLKCSGHCHWTRKTSGSG